MLYGGSYAPYFGNLYGPPNNYFFGTPFYGDFSPFWGSNGFGPSGFAGGFGNGPFCNGPNCSGPGGYPNGPWSGGAVAPAGGPVDDGAAEMPALEP
jgi:hypothetical protein